jgi:Uma2 family endonuclease
VEGRPEEERWELIDGVAVMMAPLTLAHQIIAGNLQRLLNDALEIRVPTLVACQRAGVNIGPLVEHYDPEPDVIVIDTEAAKRRENVMPIGFIWRPRSSHRASAPTLKANAKSTSCTTPASTS